jgi:hypothetical protein
MRHDPLEVRKATLKDRVVRGLRFHTARRRTHSGTGMLAGKAISPTPCSKLARHQSFFKPNEGNQSRYAALPNCSLFKSPFV